MVSKRKRRRRLKKKFKILFISLPIVVAVVLLVIYGFRINNVNYTSDLNQFTSSEVKVYLDKKEIKNTLFFWLKDKLGKDKKIDLFEDYSVKFKSPFKVTITAYEKKLAGYIKDNKNYYYVDEDGRVLKTSTEKISDIPKITGLEYNKLVMYEIIDVKDEKAMAALLKVVSLSKDYKFDIKRFDVSKTHEVSLYIKKIQVELGKEANMPQKIQAFNDLYDNVIKYEGVLNMKRLSSDQSYTLEKGKKTKKNKKQKKN